MAAQSPSKPWESNASSAIDSSGHNSVLTPPQPITKHGNNPHINRAGSSSNPPTTTAPITANTNTNTTNPTQTTQPLQTQQPLMTPGYGGGGMYGGGMYGNSMYGNSMYGGRMYGGGGMYGNSMYGGYGMGMNGMYGQMGPMGPMGFMQNMQMSVNNVGRFSQLLQVASQALHMTFSSLVQFAGNIGMLAREFGGILSGVYVFRFLKSSASSSMRGGSRGFMLENSVSNVISFCLLIRFNSVFSSCKVSNICNTDTVSLLFNGSAIRSIFTLSSLYCDVYVICMTLSPIFQVINVCLLRFLDGNNCEPQYRLVPNDNHCGVIKCRHLRHMFWCSMDLYINHCKKQGVMHYPFRTSPTIQMYSTTCAWVINEAVPRMYIQIWR